MDSQLGNYSIASDNKGILSLLTAIEQSEDHEHPETSPTKMGDKEALSVSADNFSNLNLESLEMSGDINLSNLSLCFICGRNFNIESCNNGMIDINTLIDIPGEDSRSIHSVVQEIIPIIQSQSQGDSDEDSGYVCVECFLLLDGILKLRAQIQDYVTTLNKKHLESINKKKCTKLSELLEFRLPISILNVRDSILNNVRDEEGPDLDGGGAPDLGDAGGQAANDDCTNKKTKLEILAETLAVEEQQSPSSVVETGDFQLPDSLDDNCTADDIMINRRLKSSLMTKSIDPLRLHNKPDKENRVTCIGCGGLLFTGTSRTNGKQNLFCDVCIKLRQKNVACKYCDNYFTSKVKLKHHINTVHPQLKKSQYTCDHCELEFSTRHALNKHITSKHQDTKVMHQCQECGENFQSLQSLHWHRSKHTGEFAFKCKHCNKGFNNYKLMEEHEHIHTGTKPYKCTKCPKSFANKGTLWLHIKKHDTDKPYVCDYCSKSFGHTSHLAVHKRIHTGEKPYDCRLCSEKFISGNYLKRHMKTHKDQDPFACGLCEKTFQKRSALSKHGNTEHNGKIVTATAPTISSSKSRDKLGEVLSVDESEATDPHHMSDEAETAVMPSVNNTMMNTAIPSTSTSTKEYLMIGSDCSDFIVPVNLPVHLLDTEETKDSDDHNIVLIQVSGNSQFQNSNFMQ